MLKQVSIKFLTIRIKPSESDYINSDGNTTESSSRSMYSDYSADLPYRVPTSLTRSTSEVSLQSKPAVKFLTLAEITPVHRHKNENQSSSICRQKLSLITSKCDTIKESKCPDRQNSSFSR